MNENDLQDEQVADVVAKATFAWGSFQYDEAAALYTKLCKVEEKLGREAAFASLFTTHNFGFKVGPAVLLRGGVLEKLKGALCIDVIDPEVVGNDTTEFRASLENINTVTDVLHYLRDQSWDLWGAAPYIASFVFPELDTGNACLTHAAGLICWLLKSYGFVEDDEPFKEWDT